MRILLIIMVFQSMLTSCNGSTSRPILISPSENYTVRSSKDWVFERTLQPDPIEELLSAVQYQGSHILASENGIHVFDQNKRLTKYFKFRYDSENQPRVHSVEFSFNRDNTKLLLTTSSGQSTRALIFQLDLASNEIDWLTEFDYQIVSSRYSNKGTHIALGTSYKRKFETTDSTEYYASLFTIRSEDGLFSDYFPQGESMQEIKFSNDDQYLYAVLGWPHVDTYVWSVAKKERVGAYGKDYTEYFDVIDQGLKSFVSLGSNGIYEWNLDDPERYDLIHEVGINRSSKVFALDALGQFVLVNYPNGTVNPPSLTFFSENWEVLDSLSIDVPFTNLNFITEKVTGLSGTEAIVTIDLLQRRVEKVPLALFSNNH